MKNVNFESLLHELDTEELMAINGGGCVDGANPDVRPDPPPWPPRC